MRDVALKGLAAYDHADTPKLILDLYPSLTSAEKRDALATLAARVPYARALIDAVTTRTIIARDAAYRALEDPGEMRLEPCEQIEPHTVPLAQALAMVHDGTIRDAKTLIALLLWEKRRG